MTCPNNRNFAAWINLMPGAPSKLIVTGEVETNAGNLKPHLQAREPQGINPNILILDLTIADQGGVGTADVNFREVRFEAPANAEQYSQIDITSDGVSCLIVPVTEAH